MSDACELVENGDNLIKLRNLTEDLRHLNITQRGESQEIKTESGKAFISGVFKSLQIAVSDNYAAAGTHFPGHVHSGYEIFYIKKGVMVLNIGKERYTLKAGSRPFSFDARKKHGAYFEEECEYLAITIPGDEDWPEGG